MFRALVLLQSSLHTTFGCVVLTLLALSPTRCEKANPRFCGGGGGGGGEGSMKLSRLCNFCFTSKFFVLSRGALLKFIKKMKTLNSYFKNYFTDFSVLTGC